MDPFDLQLERQYSFKNGAITLRITESFNDEDAGIGGQVWSSSVKLAHFICEEFEKVLQTNFYKSIENRKEIVVLELGSGSTGLAGLAACLSSIASFCYFSDLESSLDSLYENVSNNIHDNEKFALIALDWSKPIDYSSFNSAGIPNLILAAECLYNENSVVDFCNVLAAFPSAPCILTGVIGKNVFDIFLQECLDRQFVLTRLDCNLKQQEITPRCIMLIEQRSRK